MFSDIAGYTAIMGRDEQEAMRALDAHRGTLRTLLPKFNGTLIGEIGDGTLSSFHSAIDAVNCAREVQARVEDNPELRLRIGIHLGTLCSPTTPSSAMESMSHLGSMHWRRRAVSAFRSTCTTKFATNPECERRISARSS